MELDSNLARKALSAWRDLLKSTPLTYPELGLPEWAFAKAEPVRAYRHRYHTCYVYLFKRRQGGASGFVLNADWNRAQLIHGDSVQSLAAALSIVTTRPRATRANGRREV
jgi:hypothetical protein